MIRYAFREDGPVAVKNVAKANPQRIGEELAKLAKGSAGRLTPSAVVEAARNPRSAMHKCFEWDDAKAAAAFRLDQARDLIRVIRTVDEEDQPTRAFLSVADPSGVSYRAAQEIAGSRELQLAVLKQAERDLEAFERRYRDLQDVCESVRIVREKVSGRRAEMEARA